MSNDFTLELTGLVRTRTQRFTGKLILQVQEVTADITDGFVVDYRWRDARWSDHLVLSACVRPYKPTSSNSGDASCE